MPPLARLHALPLALLCALAACASGHDALAASPRPPVSVVEATIPELQQALRERRTTSRELVQQSLARIATFDPLLRATMAVNPAALDEADVLDRERAAGKLRGPLHGLPIALKDNIHTTFLPTTGGALAFEGMVPPYQATLTKHLLEAGAIILAKTTLTELANWVAGAPVPMPANYNAIKGYGLNPYDPRRDPREATGDGRPVLSTGGSSSGAGTAASLWVANVGTETSGSILSPANQNMLAAIKPTVGRISRTGVIPITADQDTPGPMARSVTDAAILLGVLEGKEPDPEDPATKTCPRPPQGDYTVYLKANALKGARIGIPRAFYYAPANGPLSQQPRGGLNPERAKAMAEAIEVLRREGAVVIDPADLPSVVDPKPDDNLLEWGVCTDLDEVKQKRCSIALGYGMERDFNRWLASLGKAAPVASLTALRQWNVAHQKAGALRYGQSLLDFSDALDLETYRERYLADRARDLRLTAAHGLDEALQAQSLDALLFPGAIGADVAARPGYPTVLVPFALVPNAPTQPFPAGFNAAPAPLGVAFTGTACSEPKLLSLAFAFEQATRRRVPPPATSRGPGVR